MSQLWNLYVFIQVLFCMFFANSYVGKVQVPNLVKNVQVQNLNLDANLDLLFANT